MKSVVSLQYILLSGASTDASNQSISTDAEHALMS